MRNPIIAATLLALLTGACATPYQETTQPVYALGETSKITGQISYRERIAMLPGSIATVTLIDGSRMDAPATVIDEVKYSLTGYNVPVAFQLDMPNKGIADSARLAVRAVIHSADGKLLWTTDTVHPVMTRPVDQDLGILMLRKVG